MEEKLLDFFVCALKVLQDEGCREQAEELFNDAEKDGVKFKDEDKEWLAQSNSNGCDCDGDCSCDCDECNEK